MSARDTAALPYPPLPLPATPAHVIRSDAEAIEAAHRLAALVGLEAAERDRERRLPLAEMDAFSQSGLTAITTPRELGGADVSAVTLAEVIRVISIADPSLCQIAQNHFITLNSLRYLGTPEQHALLYGRTLQGWRLGNAFSEFDTRHTLEWKTSFRLEGDEAVVNGQKFYSSGALLAHHVQIGVVDEAGKKWLAFADRDTPGLTVIDDWSSFGLRTTASGTVLIENVRLPRERLVPYENIWKIPVPHGALAQIIHTAIDVGIARAAIDETVRFVRSASRPWFDSGLEKASDDPYTLERVGDLFIQYHAAEALLERAARIVDESVANPSEALAAKSSIAVAEAKVLANDISLLATNRLFELAGTRATLARHQLDRHWRNARTHTVHDPVRWKYFHIGNYFLNDKPPPKRPTL